MHHSTVTFGIHSPCTRIHRHPGNVSFVTAFLNMFVHFGIFNTIFTII